MIFDKLAGGVAEVTQEHCDRGRARLQIGRAAGELRRDHASAQRFHAREEGIASGSATLHGDKVHENCTFITDAVDVRCFTDHQAAVVDARLHPADIIAHDEEDVGLLLLLRSRWYAHRCYQSDQRERAEPGVSGDVHDLLPGFTRYAPAGCVNAVPALSLW